MAYTVLRISDGFRKYPFLFDGNYIYWPDYNPLKFNRDPDYCLQIEGCADFVFGAEDCLACEPFIHEGYKYQQSVKVPRSGTGYIALIPWKDGRPDPDYIGAQGRLVTPSPNLTTSVELKDNYISIVFDKSISNNVLSYVRSFYSAPRRRADITVSAEIAIMDGDDVFWHNDTSLFKGGRFDFGLINWPYGNQYQWKDGLRIASIVHFVVTSYIHDPECNIKDCVDESHFIPKTIHIDVRSNPFTLTQERYGRLLQVASGNPIKINIPDDMNIVRPRLVNKTVQNVVEMTAQTDSKANIIQPIFFRSRELASIIVHPAVTENICINLDAYKASVDRFYIKIEGVAFYEIGRTESGVIFKVKGNMLPGKLTVGTYYILNQDAELVTTGKYKYEV